MLIGVRFEENGVKGGDDRRFQFAQQSQQVAAGRSSEDSELVLDRDNVNLAGIQKDGGAPVRTEVLLLNLETNDVRILIVTIDVIDRHRETLALGMPRSHRPKQV